ncbi:hypothetical protein BRC68_07595 [Halobacteriales archaeon QH_6_64_20]|nr:MAG: hypothetical protein BRC68_07595 [Halobacteriales archaeon QH_6_64_20]
MKPTERSSKNSARKVIEAFYIRESRRNTPFEGSLSNRGDFSLVHGGFSTSSYKSKDRKTDPRTI